MVYHIGLCLTNALNFFTMRNLKMTHDYDARFAESFFFLVYATDIGLLILVLQITETHYQHQVKHYNIVLQH